MLAPRIESVRAFGVVGTPLVIYTPRPGHAATITRLVAAVPAAAENVILQDAFDRTVAGGWGTPAPRSPGAWVIDAGTFSVGNSLGTASVPSGNTGRNAIRSPGIAPSTWDVRGRIDPPDTVTPAAGNIALQGIFGGVDGTSLSGFGAGLRTTNPAASGHEIVVMTSDIPTVTVGTGLFIPLGAQLEVFLRFEPTIFKMKAWQTGLPEPADFGYESITPLLTGRFVAAAIVRLNPHAASPGWVVNFDSIEATGPGAATPIWDAYRYDSSNLANIIDSSVTALDRWVPQVVNGQRFNPGEPLVITTRGGQVGAQVVVDVSMVVE